MRNKPQNYILCATPRTGSTYLCSLLKSSGVAGVPESYRRRRDRGYYQEHLKAMADEKLLKR